MKNDIKYEESKMYVMGKYDYIFQLREAAILLSSNINAISIDFISFILFKETNFEGTDKEINSIKITIIDSFKKFLKEINEYNSDLCKFSVKFEI